MSAHPSSGVAAVGNDKRVVPGICVLLAVAVLLVFGQAIRYGFINFDDDLYFFSNPEVQAGFTGPGILWAFQTMHAANWHPLTWLSLMGDVELFGTDPLGPHLTNVLLHAASTVLLFLLLNRLTGSLGRSALVAALFGLHPLHVESVAWVSERKDVLSGIFFMLTLLAYSSYVSHKPGQALRFYWLSLVLFALGLMSKPMLVTLPLVLLLLDYWPMQRFNRSTALRLAIEKSPFLMLSAASAAVTLAAQRSAIQPLTCFPPGVRIVNAAVSYMRYLYKTFWPENLAIPYPYYGYWPVWLFGVSVVLILAVTFCAVRFRRQAPYLVTGWFWYLGMLVPVLGLVQVGMQSMADRYTYLPLIGIFIMLTWGAGAVWERWRLPLPAIAGVGLLALAACTVRTLTQLPYWKSSETLFGHATAVTRGNAIAYYTLGEYYLRQDRLDEAIDNYRQAIRIRPRYDDALNNLGTALALKGELDEAVARIREAIQFSPEQADAYYNLGNVYVLQHKLDEAVAAYTDALRRKPDYPEAHNNLANVLLAQGHREAAVQHYREALRLNPGHESAKRQLRALGE